ncbi:MAG TPA: DUF4365 domain-containing protein [Gemmataceae bacterium]|nr:DUF4365 domain-containing protein [Gemmataceae bacterium]
MARKQVPPRKKRRTREHVIADLSANHVERHALLCGFSVERIVHDYGVDLILFTYNKHGETQPGSVFLQLKATERLKILAGGDVIAFRIDRADLLAWLEEMVPVILVVYDARTEVAYWLYVQAYFERQPGFDPTRGGAQVTVHVPKTNIVDSAAVRRFATFRDRVHGQAKQAVHHEE